jgi:hypothetical protein
VLPHARRLLGFVLDPFTTDRDLDLDVLDATLIPACRRIVNSDHRRASWSSVARSSPCRCWMMLPERLRPSAHHLRSYDPTPQPLRSVRNADKGHSR